MGGVPGDSGDSQTRTPTSVGRMPQGAWERGCCPTLEAPRDPNSVASGRTEDSGIQALDADNGIG